MEREKLIAALRCCGNSGYKNPDCDHCPLLPVRMCVKDMLEGAADALEAAYARMAELEEAQRWIPVGERLPEPQTKVLIRIADKTFKHTYATIAAHIGYHDAKAEDDWQEYEGETEYDEENDCFWVHPCWYEVNMVDDNPNYELDDDYEVTHWKPLPKPPEEGGKK